MIKYEDEGLVTDDPVIQAMFLHRVRYAFDSIETGNDLLIPWPTVAEAITPVEGEKGRLVFYYDGDRDDNAVPWYNHGEMLKSNNPLMVVLAANPLTIGKTVGELRELVERITKGEVDEESR